MAYRTWKGILTGFIERGTGAFSDLELISELGRGAETIVYRVRRQGEEYTLKLLTGAEAGGGRALAAVRREAALLGCVGHPLLPQIFEVGQTDTGPYLILEYIDGCPLSQTLRIGRLDEGQAVRLAIDVVAPLDAAHRAGLVHRDVKPDNVIVGPTGTARLIDFGLAARGGAREDRVAGTLLYSAPEQTGMLKRPVDGRSDLYALGVLLYECVTGQLPYFSQDAGELIRQHATAPVPDARALCPQLSPTMAAIIATLMAKDPDDRYQSGESLLADLRRLAAQPGAVFPVATDRSGVQPIGVDVLVGRDQEVVDLANRWLKARAGVGGAVVVEGPAGAGKSRLVRELTTAVETDGDLVLYGKCGPDDPVPLAPLRAAVERYLRTVERLPTAEREHAIQRLRRAAGRGGPLLRTLSPLLADLVQAPEIGDLDRHEQFINAVAAFLVGLADEFQGAVLHVDDVQWLDGSTRRVLQQVTNRLPGTPLLVIATSRDDEDNAAALARFGADMDATLDTRVQLLPLDRDAVTRLVASHLGGVRLADEEVEELAVRAGGNPFTVGEYVRAVVDAGLIAPGWGGWRLDLAGLDRLELSDDAVDLVLQRIDGLGAEVRQVLAAGAAAGRRFRADLVAAVCGIMPQRARVLLAEAERYRLVTASSGEGYRFLHDRIREALLAGVDAAELRRLHQRIAEVLKPAAPADASYIYAIARHYALGETHRTPDRVYASGLAAGRLALAEHVPAEALDFLEVAARAAQAAGITPEPDFFVTLGRSCTRTGRFVEALSHFDRALRDEPDRLRRAGIRAQVARLHNSAWSPDRAFEAVRAGLAELGTPLPRGRLWLTMTTLVSVAVGLAVGRTGIGFGTAAGRRRERYRLQAILCDTGAYAASMRMRRSMRALMGLRALYAVNRLGPGQEYARHMAGLGLMADVAGRPQLATRLYDRAAAVAADIGDPELVGYIEWKRGAGSHLSGRDDDGQTWMRALVEHERWLELGDYLTGVSSVCVQLFKRGRTHDAEAWYLRGKARLGPGAQAEGAAIGPVAAAIAAQRGRADEAADHIEALRRFLAANPDNPMQLINLYAAMMISLVERNELGEPFEQLTAEFAALGIKLASMVPEQKVYYVYEALGRLAQCHQAGMEATPERREACRAAAEQVVARLEKMADTKPLRAFHRVAHADLEVLAGRPREALQALADAELELLPLDAPLIAYEAARVHARAMLAIGEPAQAAHHARIARMLAADQQWPQRIRWIRDEFGVGDSRSVSLTGSVSSTGGGSTDGSTGRSPRVSGSGGAAGFAGTTGSSRGDRAGGSAALYRRRLRALQQVSLASATVLDPRELARVALDETLRIVGAERAYLFLLDLDLDQLVPHVGRDREGNDIAELTGYSSTLVDRVRYSGETLVVTGSEEGVALGSRSAQIHGLRSILITPLKFDGHLRGVVYLDSRIAKGVFTADDVDILKAITNHIAVSLETARAAQLELAVQAVRRQRDLAETLRAAMAEQSSSLDPDEVMRRLLASLTRTLGADSAVLLTRLGYDRPNDRPDDRRDDRRDDRLVVAAAHGPTAAVGTQLYPVPSGLLDLTGPQIGTAAPGTPPPFGELLGSPRSWWAIPVAEHGEPYGILLAAGREGVMTEAQAQTAAAIAGQGMTAYENARLFSQVRRMAIIDGLTGLYNRNQFFVEADRQLRTATRFRRPFAAIMVDIDHFKHINDTYGHPVGDQVIRVVAERLRDTRRGSDVLGRYGGEEFAMVTPETGPSAADLAERLRQAVSAQPIPTAAGQLPVTISVGLAYLDGSEQDLRQLLTRADRALYQAKQTGRNRVCVAR